LSNTYCDYHTVISYIVLFKWRLVKVLSGNNYTILHAVPPIYAVILPDVVINMWEIIAYNHGRGKEAVSVNPVLYNSYRWSEILTLRWSFVALS